MIITTPESIQEIPPVINESIDNITYNLKNEGISQQKTTAWADVEGEGNSTKIKTGKGEKHDT